MTVATFTGTSTDRAGSRRGRDDQGQREQQADERADVAPSRPARREPPEHVGRRELREIAPAPPFEPHHRGRGNDDTEEQPEAPG